MEKILRMKNFGKIHSLKAHSLLLLLLFTSYERIFVPSSALVPVEQDVLLGIKEVWNDPDFVLSSWAQDSNCSDWNGITCDENGNVIEMSFENNQFSSFIPSSIGQLTSLQKITLKNNQLFGPIPDSFRNLTDLTSLDLSNNKINGSFPSSILALKNIKYIYIPVNQLTGPLPSSIDNLNNLVHLVLRNNQLSGPIPSSIGNLSNLIWLLLSTNSFSGTLPSSLTNLTQLDSLWLYGNELSGPIPPLELMDSILVLYLSVNYFNGSAINCTGECDLRYNCLTNISETQEYSTNPQRNSSECSSFYENLTSPSPSPLSPTPSSPSPSPSPSPSLSPSPSPSLFVPSPLSPPFASSYTPSPPFPSSKPSNTNLGLIIGIPIPIVLFLIIFAIIFCLLFRKYKRKENINENESTGKFHPLPKKEFQIEVQKLSLNRFSLRELQTMTRGFDVSMTLGSGGFGTVYKGIMPSGELCAVKKAKKTSVRSLHDFQKEVFALAQLNHFNIVKLLGYCDEANENILIYEHVENGSLSKILLLPKDHPHFLTFEKRVQIARDCALGLHYLHNLSNKQLIHRDVKSDNILLDAKFTAKIADFGLLKINDENLSAIKTSPCGTPGYVDPEYFKTLTLTNKSDVYSFGVVLLELITGKRSIFVIDDPDAPNGRSNQSLVSWARPVLQSNNLDELIDPNLKGEYEPEALQSLASLAASCLRPSHKDRPGMDEVSSRLGVILYGKASEIQEDENYVINLEDNHGEFILADGGNTSSSNSSISNRVPVMSKSFRAR